MKNYARVLVIAGSDSGGGAGIQADIKAISACGAYAMTAITALTIQNTLGVRGVHLPDPQVISGQIDAVLDDIGADAVKIGMLPTAAIVRATAEALKRHDARNIVLDPVMVATSGDELIDNEAVSAIIEHLLPMATLVTPNIPEAERMTGLKITSEADFAAAAKRLGELGAKAVLLKAGHLESPILTDHLFTLNSQLRRFAPDFLSSFGKERASSTLRSLLRKFSTLNSYSHPRVNTKNTHGTGCTLSAAIAAFMARGERLEEAVELAENYLQGAIAAGAEYTLGRGRGPVHHFYKYW